MSIDTEGLHLISPRFGPNPDADIVFVHGTGGAAHRTWRHGTIGHADHHFWPEVLSSALPQCRVWSIGYAAGLTELGNPGMVIEMRAGNVVQQLTTNGVGNRPLVFITHSMGGLVVKAILVRSALQVQARWKALVENIKGVMFLGTPHRGSAFASAAALLLNGRWGAQKHVRQMRANADGLDLLHDQFLQWHRDHPIPIESYAESRAITKRTIFGRFVPLGVVVTRSSANPGVGVIHDVDADHWNLVKPTPNDAANYAVVYKGSLRFVEEALSPVEQRLSQGFLSAVMNWLEKVIE